MAIQVVQHASNTATYTSGTTGQLQVTFGSPTTAGNCLVACITAYEGPTDTLVISSVTTNGAAENWVSAASLGGTAGEGDQYSIYVNPNTSGSQTIIDINVTFGFTASTSNSACILSDIYEVSGLVLANVIDKSVTQSQSAVTSWNSTATATTSQVNEIWLGMAAADSSSGNTAITLTGPASPWTNETQLQSSAQDGGTGTSNKVIIDQISSYQIVSSTGAATYSGTNTPSAFVDSLVVTLKGIPLPPGTPVQPGSTWIRNFRNHQIAQQSNPGNITLRGTTAQNVGTTTATTLAVKMPSTVIKGDFLGIWCGAPTSTNITFSASGWNTVSALNSSNTVAGQLLWKTAAGNEAGTSVTVTCSASELFGAVAFAYANVNDTTSVSMFDQLPAVSGTGNASSTTVGTNNIQTNFNQDVLVWIGMIDAASGGTPAVLTVPAGFTPRITQTNTTSASATNAGILMGDWYQNQAGIFTGDGTAASGHANAGFVFALTQGQAVPYQAPPTQCAPGVPWRRRFKPRHQVVGIGGTGPANIAGPDSDNPVNTQFANQAVTINLTAGNSGNPVVAQFADQGISVTVTGNDADNPAVAQTGSVDAGEVIPAVPVSPGFTWRRFFRPRAQARSYTVGGPVNLAGPVVNITVASQFADQAVSANTAGSTSTILVAAFGGPVITAPPVFAPVSAGSTWRRLFRPHAQEVFWTPSPADITGVIANINITAQLTEAVVADVPGPVSNTSATALAGSVIALENFPAIPVSPGREWTRRFRPRSQQRPYVSGADLFGVTVNITAASAGTVSIGPAEAASNVTVAAYSGPVITALPVFSPVIPGSTWKRTFRPRAQETWYNTAHYAGSSSGVVANITIATQFSDQCVTITQLESASGISVAAKAGTTTGGNSWPSSPVFPGHTWRRAHRPKAVVPYLNSGANLLGFAGTVTVAPVTGSMTISVTGTIANVAVASSGVVSPGPANSAANISVTASAGMAGQAGPVANVVIGAYVGNVENGGNINVGSPVSNVAVASHTSNTETEIFGKYAPFSPIAAAGVVNLSTEIISAITTAAPSDIVAIGPANQVSGISVASHSMPAVVIPGPVISMNVAALAQTMTVSPAPSPVNVAVAAISGIPVLAPALVNARITVASVGTTSSSPAGTVANLAISAVAGSVYSPKIYLASPVSPGKSWRRRFRAKAQERSSNQGTTIFGAVSSIAVISQGSVVITDAGSVPAIAVAAVTGSPVAVTSGAITNLEVTARAGTIGIADSALSNVTVASYPGTVLTVTINGTVANVPVIASPGVASSSTMPLDGAPAEFFAAGRQGSTTHTITGKTANVKICAIPGLPGRVRIYGSLSVSEWGGKIAR